jgi:hypothetical protein
MKPVPVQDEPTMYSYNGTILPPLPEEYGTIYPYASINVYKKDFIHTSIGDYEVVLYKYPLTLTTVDYEDGPQPVCVQLDLPEGVTDTSYIVYYYRISEPENGWVYKKKYTQARVIYLESTDVVWSNKDILNEDGSVYFKASEPIPVYE